MVKYLNTPLKVAGMLLTVAGIVLSIITLQHADYMGVSVLLMGLVVLCTGLVMPRSSIPGSHRIALELFLVTVILFIALVLIMDYYGLVVIQKFISIL